MGSASTPGLIEELRQEYQRAALEDFDRTVSLYTESPIEALFLAQMLVDGWRFPSQMEWTRLTNDREAAVGGTYTTILASSECACMCIPQLSVSLGENRYRIDFAFVARLGDRNTLIAVELDGHDFHERTKEQASKDKKRDRVLSANGWTVLRFTGSDVHRNVYGTVSEVIQLANRKVWG